ncbi:serine acetyltransferase [bacterium]|nr:serine acetyltransferase [bacterium]
MVNLGFAHQIILNTADALIGGCAAESSSAMRNFAGMRELAVRLLNHLRCAMFPHIFSDYDKNGSCLADTCVVNLQNAFELLKRILRLLIDEEKSEICALELIEEIPEIKCMLLTDVEAAYKGDPAAVSADEIMLTYPAFEAISVYRIAHKLHSMEIPILPRLMSEYAHQSTGIDIHPGARIGRYFFIDHGTGVVIGETAVIGENVKIYQNVTLGAKSFAVNKDGSLVKGIKRHPRIGNNVVIYAGATILGGDTAIGDNAVIGGNTWITHSVPANTLVLADSYSEVRKSKEA